MPTPVDSIGTILNPSTASPTEQTAIRQEDFIRLFMSQLQFQDPLEPVDNREFLAQLAQFSSLEQSRQTSENTNAMLSMDSSSQALGLLNRSVQTHDGEIGTVIAVRFTQEGPLLDIRQGSGSTGTVIPNVRLSMISLVRPAAVTPSFP